MTVTFAMAIGDVRLVAADTRLNFSFRDGRSGTHDSGPIDVTFSDGMVLRVGDHYRKIRPVGADWACGAGFFALVEAGLAALASVQSSSSARTVLSTVRAKEVARLEREFNAQRSDVERAAILFTVTNGATTGLAGYRFDDSNPVPPGSQFVFQAPPDLPQSENARITSGLHNELVAPSTTAQLYTVIRAVARAFSRVVPHSRTVSDRMEVGVTVSHGSRYRLSAGMTNTASASDDEMRRLLESA